MADLATFTARAFRNVALRLFTAFLLLSDGLSEETKRDDTTFSPLFQNLPNCAKGDFVRIAKKTSKKACVCPMIRDEEGFLSEWVAYYQMHGFDHVFLYNDGSIDNSLVELQPWIDVGFVTVKSNFTAETLNIHPGFKNQAFKLAMATKALLETDCKLEAIRLGYDYQMSLDLDEYVIPHEPGVTVVDEFDRFVTTTGRPSYCVTKLNFQSSPHILEPINLLSIEAYQTRVKAAAKMNYYTSVAPKCAYQLRGKDFRNNTSEYIAKCCHFHGCQKFDFIAGETVCNKNNDDENWRISGKGKPWMDAMTINHYSRSLEKFALKQKTWKTSTGEIQAGQSSAQAASSYDIPKFLARSVGFHFDNTALRYTCQLRELLRNMTGQPEYLRPGNFWYRNPEFGKTIADPNKRGRYGRQNAPGFKAIEPNPYNYHGGVHGDKNADRSAAEKELSLAATAAASAAAVAPVAPGRKAKEGKEALKPKEVPVAAAAVAAEATAAPTVAATPAVPTPAAVAEVPVAVPVAAAVASETTPVNPVESVIGNEALTHGNGTRMHREKGGKNGEGKNHLRKKQKKNGKGSIINEDVKEDAKSPIEPPQI